MHNIARAVAVFMVFVSSAFTDERVDMAVLAILMSVCLQGMGNVGLGGDDSMKAWSNPALMADQGTQGEVALNGASMFGGEQVAGGGEILEDKLLFIR